jgi:DNA-binding transcriptional MerR regulator
MRVNELAIKMGVTPDTVRFYTRVGLLNPKKSLENGYKNYDVDEQNRLLFIVKARHLGFSVSEIQQIVKMSKRGNSPCCKVRAIAKKRLEETQQNIKELLQLSAKMEMAINVWEQLPDGLPTGGSLCSLIEMWEDVDLFDTDSKRGTTKLFGVAAC